LCFQIIFLNRTLWLLLLPEVEDRTALRAVIHFFFTIILFRNLRPAVTVLAEDVDSEIVPLLSKVRKRRSWSCFLLGFFDVLENSVQDSISTPYGLRSVRLESTRKIIIELIMAVRSLLRRQVAIDVRLVLRRKTLHLLYLLLDDLVSPCKNASLISVPVEGLAAHKPSVLAAR